LLTRVITVFGFAVLAALHIEVRAAFQGLHRGGEFDTAVRFVDNAIRGVAGVITWIVLWVVVLLPWQLLSAWYHTSQPHLAHAIADVGGALMSFVVAGFCIYMIRTAVAVTLAARETHRGYVRLEEAILHGDLSSTASPDSLARIALVLTTPTDLDLLMALAIGLLVGQALVGYAHSRGFPLSVVTEL
jgi:hypothetical protein